MLYNTSLIHPFTQAFYLTFTCIQTLMNTWKEIQGLVSCPKISWHADWSSWDPTTNRLISRALSPRRGCGRATPKRFKVYSFQLQVMYIPCNWKSLYLYIIFPLFHPESGKIELRFLIIRGHRDKYHHIATLKGQWSPRGSRVTKVAGVPPKGDPAWVLHLIDGYVESQVSFACRTPTRASSEPGGQKTQPS